MPTAAQPKPSFTPHRKWSIGFNVFLIVLIVFSVVGMVNYLSQDYFYRLHWSTRTKVELSPLTVKFLNSLTNQVRIIVYYDKEEPLYGTVMALLNEYRLSNPRISLQTVDYIRDPAAANEIKKNYKLAAVTDRNLIIFDCEGKSQPVPGDVLAKYVNEQVPNEKQPTFRRKPTEFYGEKWFTSALLAVTSPKVQKAYALEHHGEHNSESKDATFGYAQFAALLGQYLISLKPLSLVGTNALPDDCQLLIVAGPQKPLYPEELEKIDQYLSQGGRLFVMFNVYSTKTDTGLEGVLAKYGIDVGHNLIIDPENQAAASYGMVVVSDFGPHPISNPLMENSLALVNPRSIGKLKTPPQAAEALRVEEIAWSGTKAYSKEDPARTARRFPFIVVAEKAAPRGITERGSCRIVVVGDSLFLSNTTIDSGGNRDFAIYAVNWLLNRTHLLEELGSGKILVWKIIMTRSQLKQTQWLLLAVMPGAALLFGTLVWLRRRR